mgnify:CR=1 FL=1
MLPLIISLSLSWPTGVAPDPACRKSNALQVITRDEAICMAANNEIEKEGWLGAISK